MAVIPNGLDAIKRKSSVVLIELKSEIKKFIIYCITLQSDGKFSPLNKYAMNSAKSTRKISLWLHVIRHR